MSANSQFQQLRQQVKVLSAELERVRSNQGTSADIASQKQMLKNVRQQQAQAKQTLANPNATAEELETASQFLPTLGLREQARMDARDKRMAEELQAFSSQQLIIRTDLIENARASHLSGEYQNLRESMKQDRGIDFSTDSRNRPTANAMKSVQALTRNQWEAQQLKMEIERSRPIGSPSGKTQTNSMPVPLSNWF